MKLSKVYKVPEIHSTILIGHILRNLPASYVDQTKIKVASMMISYLFVSVCGTPGLLPAVVEGAATVGVVEVAEGEDTRPAGLGPGQGDARLAKTLQMGTSPDISRCTKGPNDKTSSSFIPVLPV